jgi:putative DNA primase/helicase
MLVENLVQGVARDLLADAMERLEAAGYPVVGHVHDEVIVEMPVGAGSLEEFQRIITTLPDWAAGLPIAAKVREGARWIKDEPATAAEMLDANDGARGDYADDSDEHAQDDDYAGNGDNDARTDDLEQDQPGDPEHYAPQPDAPEPGPAPWQSAGGPSTAANEPPPLDAENLGADAPGADNAHDAPGTGTRYARNGHTHDRNGYPHGEERAGRLLAAYLYRNHLGQPYLRVEKRAPPPGKKRPQYPQAFWTGYGWIRSKPKDWLKIPYRLPELLAAQAAAPSTVFIPEGEKDADNVAALGLVATTSAEGATPLKAKVSNWTPELNRWFHGVRRVFILEDNDEPGRKFAREKAQALDRIVPDIRIVAFPDVPEGEDVSWWLALGHSKDELLARCEAAPRWQRDGYVLVRASDIVPRAMDWLWQGHILRGSQELLTGIPGNGKSQIHCAFVAYITTGGAWLDGCNGAPAGNVIMLTAEDCLDQTIVPRLIAAGADRDRVFVLRKIRRDNKERMFLLSEDLEELERMIVKTGDVRLITIDPITAYMGGKLDSHRATDVRGQLGPLADLAERLDVALSAITHPPKHATQRAIDHFIGSQAFIAAARIGHMAIEEISEDEHGNKMPTGRSLFTNPKNNVSRKMSTLAYRIVEKPLDGGIKAACVTWEEIVDITADQAIAATAPNKNRDKSGAQVFLFTILANGPVAVKLIEERAGAHGFSKDQLKRAKQKFEIVAFREKGKFDGGWFWALPQHAPDETTEDPLPR